MRVTGTEHNVRCVFMSCTLDINSNGGFKQACGISLFNFISPLPQFL